MINFNALPTNRPTNLPEPGSYYFTIETAEMKQGQDVTKPMYLNMCLALQDKAGHNVGKIYDVLTESDSSLIQYKIGRFLIALGLQDLGNFELIDLTKIIKNKRGIVDVKIEQREGKPDRAVVDLFSGSIYYPMSDAKEIFGEVTANESTHAEVTDDPLVIDAIDAADVHPADDDDLF